MGRPIGVMMQLETHQCKTELEEKTELLKTRKAAFSRFELPRPYRHSTARKGIREKKTGNRFNEE